MLGNRRAFLRDGLAFFEMEVFHVEISWILRNDREAFRLSLLIFVRNCLICLVR